MKIVIIENDAEQALLERYGVDAYLQYCKQQAPRATQKVDRQFRTKAPKGPFLWLTHSGDLVKPANMATPHLYYAIRMLFNHTVPAKYRTPESVQEIIKYKDVPKWSVAYKKAAAKALRAEFDKRSTRDLTQAMRDGVRWMNTVNELLESK